MKTIARLLGRKPEPASLEDITAKLIADTQKALS